MNRTYSTLERNLGWGVLLLLFAACVLVLLPFLSAMLWAVILSYSVWPIYRRILRRVGDRPTLAALIVTLSLILGILLPFAIVGSKVAGNIEGLRSKAQVWAERGLPPPPSWLRKTPVVGPRAADYWQGLSTDRERFLSESKRLIEPAIKILLTAGLAVGSGLIQLTLSIFVAFFLLRDGAAAADRLTAIIHRIGGERGAQLLVAAGDTVRGVVYGILGTALLQAVMAGLGFLVAGVPGIGLLVLLTFFLSVVPMGPPLVLVPAALWLFAQGSTGWGIFMLVWGLVVSSVDNFVKPWLISQGSDLPFVLIFLGVVGGAIAFGFIGVFIGPTLLSVVYRLMHEWSSAGRQSELNVPEADSENAIPEKSA